MNADQYLQERLDPEISWYASKSLTNKRYYVGCQITQIVCAAIIPFLAGSAGCGKSGGDRISLAIGILGVLVAICVGVSSVQKFQELWIKYRATAESLKKEKFLFQTKVEPYNADNPLPIFVQRVELLISQENTNWTQYMMKPLKTEGGDETASQK